MTQMIAAEEAWPRFDGAAAWSTLTAEQQAEIGAIALEYVLAVNGCAALFDPLSLTARERSFAAAQNVLLNRLFEVAEDAFPQPLGEEAVPLPIPSLLGPVCRTCGCSQDDACEGGCAWAEPDLCTACAGHGGNRGRQ